MENNTTPTQESVETSQYWRSLDEKYQTPEFLKTIENEFHSSPLKEEDGKDGLARRQFMKLMGASVALTAAACVRRPVQKIIPYNKRPAEIIPDVANYYASSYFDGTQGLGLIVKTLEGRPLFVSGNPEHPQNGKGISARASAHILSLYDPDRLKGPMVNSINPKKRRNSIAVKRTWEQVDAKVGPQLKKGGVAILTSSNPSPHSRRLMDAFVGKFGGKRYVWDIMTTESLRKAQKMSYGAEAVPRYHFDKAKTVVAIDCDFIGTYIAPVEFMQGFKKSHDPESEDMARLISFHSVPSLTSLNADDVYPVRASHQLGVALGLLEAVMRAKGQDLPGGLAKFNDTQLGLPAGTLAKVAKDLVANSGKSIVIAGGLQSENENSIGLQLAVNWLNSALGNEGRTISARGGFQGLEGSSADIEQLMADIEKGTVKTLIVHNLNPIYALPPALKFEEALNKVEMLISTANWMDESTLLADIVAPNGHAMENWNEYEFSEGVKSIQQPTIRPLNDSRCIEDSLIAWSKAAGSPVANENNFHEILKKASGSDKDWFAYLQTGYKGEMSAAGSSRGLSATGIKPAPIKAEGLELVMFPTVHQLDGTLTNVSWLQELPDPVTKIVWDNCFTVSPARAKEMGLKDGSMVEVTAGEVTVKGPAFVHPGQHDDVVGLAVGYGRTSGGELQKNVGINAFALTQMRNGQLVYSAIPIQMKKISGFYELAVTQGHNSMEGRQIVAETTFKSYKHGTTGIHKHKIFSMWGKHKYEGHKWGMAIDLNACTGCSACMMACQSENNIPVVGKKYVLQGREMHWIRIDRYYSGSEAAPDSVFQPVMCQHCENAPCETVCPVLATTHSDEGLNDMVYNRCVGTRYCANNCPYKVRRFNWFYYDGHHRKEPLHMALNPDVTVRTRGVMEKCSFCVQRIKEGKGTAKDENRPLKDGDIQTACQEVCPTSAIVFGDLNDKTSAVAKWFQAPREYALLEELNAAPRVRYLAKVRNTDRELGGHHGPAQDAHGAAPQEHAADKGAH